MAVYSARECEILFDQSAEGQDILHKGVTLYRTKSVYCARSGMYYVTCYPIWDTQAQASEAKRETEKRKSSEAQRRLNQRNAQTKLEQLVNANFGEGDLYVGLTYTDEQQPEDDKQAQRDIQNYFKRVRTLRKRKGLPELKYVYVTEITHSQARGTRYHHHLIMNGEGIDRDEAEALWRKGLANTKRCQYQDANLSAMANYISKTKESQDKAGRRRWNCSKNLIKPRVTTADHKISRRKVERIAKAIEDDGRRIFEKAYPGYRVVDEIKVKRSEYVAGAYVYVKMRKRD